MWNIRYILPIWDILNNCFNTFGTCDYQSYLESLFHHFNNNSQTLTTHEHFAGMPFHADGTGARSQYIDRWRTSLGLQGLSDRTSWLAWRQRRISDNRLHTPRYLVYFGAYFFQQKKITHYCACSFYGPGPICAPASRKTTNGWPTPNSSPPFLQFADPRCIGDASRLIWLNFSSMPPNSGHSAMLRSPKSCVSTNGYTISNWVRRAIWNAASRIAKSGQRHSSTPCRRLRGNSKIQSD